MRHRNKTLYEDLYIIDKSNGELIAFETSSKTAKQIIFSEETIKTIKEHKGKLVLLHNHPNSSTFSPSDINLLTNAESIDTVIACGHDGGVHIASGLSEKFNIEEEFEREYNRYKKIGFTGLTSGEKSWKKLSEIYKFNYERR